MLLTWGDIIIRLDGNVLIDFHVIDVFQDGQPMANTGDPHFLEFIVFQCHQCFAFDAMLCSR